MTNDLQRRPFEPADVVYGEDGQPYHLPTLRTLYAAGRLAQDSAGYAVLMRHEPRRPHLIA